MVVSLELLEERLGQLDAAVSARRPEEWARTEVGAPGGVHFDALAQDVRSMTPAEQLTTALSGRWYSDYGMACCPAHRDQSPSLSIRNGRRGRLLLKCHAGCSYRNIVAALQSRGLHFPVGSGSVAHPEADARHAQEAERSRRERMARADQILAGALSAEGTIVERYLQNRAIRVPVPGALRFAPSCRHPSGEKCAAMVAKVEVVGEAKPVAIHRTFLWEPGRKAQLEPARAMLGPVMGGAVRLSEGSGPLVVAEGIETALSLLELLARHEPRVWAALCADGVAGLKLPEEPHELVVAPDPDPTGRAKANKLAERAHRAGWRVRILNPPDSESDWNDLAMKGNNK